MRLKEEINERVLDKKDAALSALREDFEAFKQKVAEEEEDAWKDGYAVYRSEMKDAVKKVDPNFDWWEFGEVLSKLMEEKDVADAAAAQLASQGVAAVGSIQNDA